jgi:hypothetical protein
MAQVPQNRDSPRIDPDSIVIELLVNLAATGLAGLLAKLGSLVLRLRRDRNAALIATKETLPLLEDQFQKLKQAVENAASLTGPETRLVVGGGLLLDPNAIRRYHELREGIFAQLRTFDDVSEKMLSRIDEIAPHAAPASDRNLPTEFRTQIKFIDKRLRDARVANYAEGAFLEIRAALLAIERVIAQIRQTAELQ